MGNIDISGLTSPIDDYLFNRISSIDNSNTLIIDQTITKKPTISIGDGGNEIGMGNTYFNVVKHVKNG